jgi:hypothetical protein
VGSTVGTSSSAGVTVGVGAMELGAVARPAKKLPAATARINRTIIAAITLFVFGLTGSLPGVDGVVCPGCEGVAETGDAGGVDPASLVSEVSGVFTCFSSIPYYGHIYSRKSMKKNNLRRSTWRRLSSP